MTAKEDVIDRPRSREPATAVFARRVKPGRGAEYERLAGQMVEASKAFPGQPAATVLHEPDSPGYTVLYSFTDRPALQAWLDSPGRRHLLRRADQLAEQQLRLPPLTGLETWFTPPRSDYQTAAALEDVARLAVRDLSARRDLSVHDRPNDQDVAPAGALGSPPADLADVDDLCGDAARDTSRATVAVARHLARKVTR